MRLNRSIGVADDNRPGHEWRPRLSSLLLGDSPREFLRNAGSGDGDPGFSTLPQTFEPFCAKINMQFDFVEGHSR